MNLTIHTYGYYDALYNVLQGLAMFRNSGFYTTLVEGIAVLVGCYYGIRIANTVHGDTWRQYLMKMIGMMFFINTLLLPKTEMILKDHVSKTIGKIDNIPVAFALPVGMIEEFGRLITIGFEQIFSPIEIVAGNNFPYYQYGMAFGARLAKEASQSKIKDPRFISNMSNFMKQCVVMPAMIGHQFTKEQLVSTSNMWKLVKDKAGTLTRVDITTPSGKTSMTCKEATEYFEGEWEMAILGRVDRNQMTDFGRANKSEKYVPSNNVSQIRGYFEANLEALYGSNIKATDIIRQQMMINSLNNYRSSKYGVVRSRMQQESSGLLSSDLASIYLPMMLAVFKCIIYAAFIFLVPMLLFSGGITKYTSYLTIVASLQLWPAINSVLNMIISTYTYSDVTKGSGLILSFSAMSTVNKQMDTIVTIAGGMQITVPFLAYWMTNIGGAGLMHLAGNVVGSIQSNAGSVGAELATGNRNVDNVNEGNVQRNMQSANKSDFNMQYFDGVNSTQLGSGAMERSSADGTSMINSGSGITESSGSRRFNLETSQNDQISQGMQIQKAFMESDQRSYSDAKSATFSKASDYVAHLAQREHNGESFNYDQQGEQGRALQQAVNNTKQLHDKRGYGWNQAAQTSLQGELSLSNPLKLFKSIKSVSSVDSTDENIASTKANINTSNNDKESSSENTTLSDRLLKTIGSSLGGVASIQGTINASNNSEQSSSEDITLSRDNNVSNNYHNIVRATSNSSWAQENSIDRGYSDSVRSNYEEQQRLESQISMRQEKMQSYHDAQTRLQSQGASQSRDMYHEVEQKVQEVLGVDKARAHSLIEMGDSRVDKIWNQMVHDSLPQLQDIGVVKNNLSDFETVRQLDLFSNQHEGKIDANDQHRIKYTALRDSMAVNEIAGNIETTKDEISKNFNEIDKENDSQVKAVKQYNEMETRDLQKLVDEYEKNRIGKGWVSKRIAEATGIIGLGNVGWEIGAPDKSRDSINDGINVKKQNKSKKKNE